MSQVGDDRPPPSPRKVKKQVPQKTVDDFWTAFSTKFPGKVHSIIPNNAYAKSKKKGQPKGTVYGQGTHQSYEEAKADCVSTVEMIAKECNRVNMRYRDPHFDIEFDLKSGKRDCLNGLLVYPDAGRPKSVKRVHVCAHEYLRLGSILIDYDSKYSKIHNSILTVRPLETCDKADLEIAGFLLLSAHWATRRV